MASSIFDSFLKLGAMMGLDRKKMSDAQQWFRNATGFLRHHPKGQGGLRDMSANEFMKSDPTRLQNSTQMFKTSIGSMFLFYYDPKHKETLPYYDRFPLVFPLELYKDGFLGINLHYLAPRDRARLMDRLYSELNNKKMDDTTRLRISYSILKGASRYKLFKPCVKRYLYAHVRSRYFKVNPQEWELTLYLPLERFEKANKTKVWQESRKKT